MTSTDPDAFDASPGDLLTIVQLNALQTMAALQVLQGHISDQGAVVQFHHSEALLATGTAAQSSDAIISDQLAVGQGLSRAQQGWRHTDKWIKAPYGCRTWHKIRAAGVKVYQCLQARAVDRQLNQGVICHLWRGKAWLTYCSHVSRDSWESKFTDFGSRCCMFVSNFVSSWNLFFVLCHFFSVSLFAFCQNQFKYWGHWTALSPSWQETYTVMLTITCWTDQSQEWFQIQQEINERTVANK